MARTPQKHITRRLRIVAQDPGVQSADGSILTATVDVPAEELAEGPWGYRVQVIDYDASTGTLFKALEYEPAGGDGYTDPYAEADDETLLGDPRFHAQNAYAIVMRTLARFEFALGRRVGWSFGGHQLKVAPHAFADANAFYSRRDEALLFGYFAGEDGTVFSSLSHDVVAHETTHALVDGLRERYVDPSSPDQAAFHEGFADVVALLSVFSLREVVETLLVASDQESGGRSTRKPVTGRVTQGAVTEAALKKSALLSLAEQMGQELSLVRGRPLRRSLELEPSPKWLDAEEFQEPHRRGEILVACVLGAFVKVWVERLSALGERPGGGLDLRRVAEEGAKAADHLLTICIRAIDYSTPVHMEYCDYLSALLTADYELHPEDDTYHYREHLRESFAAFGLKPSSKGGSPPEPGIWVSPDDELIYDRTRFESLTRDSAEVFRFVWENRKALRLTEGVYTRVLSVRPSLRIGSDGFFLRETVAEFVQQVTVRARELPHLFDVRPPKEMPPDTQVTLYGGGTLIFDEYGRLKFHVRNQLADAERQTRRLEYLWQYGHFTKGASLRDRFSHMHRLRSMNTATQRREGWH